jgi:hypothetical protein
MVMEQTHPSAGNLRTILLTRRRRRSAAVHILALPLDILG